MSAFGSCTCSAPAIFMSIWVMYHGSPSERLCNALWECTCLCNVPWESKCLCNVPFKSA